MEGGVLWPTSRHSSGDTKNPQEMQIISPSTTRSRSIFATFRLRIVRFHGLVYEYKPTTLTWANPFDDMISKGTNTIDRWYDIQGYKHNRSSPSCMILSDKCVYFNSRKVKKKVIFHLFSGRGIRDGWFYIYSCCPAEGWKLWTYSRLCKAFKTRNTGTVVDGKSIS